MNVAVVVPLNEPGGERRDRLWLAERYVIAGAMKRANGNITHAAELLGIKRQSLQRKLKKLELR